MLHSIFWRTFGLIALLLGGSLLAWLLLLQQAQEQPRTVRFAAETASLINLTRAGLLAASDAERALLLATLDQDERIRVMAADESDRVLPWPHAATAQALLVELQRRIPGARLASEVNAVPGLWIGFDIDADPYWLLLDPERLERHQSGLALGGWLVAAIGLALLGALWITRIVHQPLKTLASRLHDVACGQAAAPLPESGPRELRRVHRQFNHMTRELARLDADRSVALAGISHDLRSPLTRMRLELELADLPEVIRDSLNRNIDQIDQHIGQFVEFARPLPNGPWEPIELPSVLARCVTSLPRIAERPRPDCQLNIPAQTLWRGPLPSLERIIHNLLLNAVTHGAGADGRVRVDLSATRTGPGVLIDLRDHGPGVQPSELARLLRPFERGEAARTGAQGSGLGLAIVNQIARRHGGGVRLALAPGGGLRVLVWLQDGPPPYKDPLWQPTAIDQIN